MLWGFCGGIGTGKTLNSIKEIIENDDFAGRPVYYHGIRCLLLDYDVCNSFSGWLYGVYWPANTHNKELEKKLLKIDEQGRLATLEDFPYLAFQYRQHEPFSLWLNWFKKLASPKRLDLFKESLSVLNLDEESITWDDIKDLHLSWHSFDDPSSLASLPSGSVILVDEVQNIWPTRAAGRKVPEEVEFVTTHRHKGIDLVYISQDFRDVDQIIRRRMQHLVYYEFIGGDWLHRYSHIEGFDPSSPTELAKAEKKKTKRDSKYYGVYLSSVKHTQKPKLDPQIKKGILMLVLAIVSICGCIYYTYSIFNKDTVDASKFEENQATSQQKITSNPAITYLEKYIPRMEDLPFSAPIYDDLTRSAINYPDLTCVIHINQCSCFTQQGSSYSVSDEMCISVARYGYFDPYKSSNNMNEYNVASKKGSSKNNKLNKGGVF